MTSAKPTRSAVSGRTRTRMLCEGAIMVALAQKAAEGGATFYYETPCVQLVQELSLIHI